MCKLLAIKIHIVLQTDIGEPDGIQKRGNTFNAD